MPRQAVVQLHQLLGITDNTLLAVLGLVTHFLFDVARLPAPDGCRETC
jgi:hypothetical protein